jgi:anti-sigma regulatory factor (Ser/Thr protein kinase)
MPIVQTLDPSPARPDTGLNRALNLRLEGGPAAAGAARQAIDGLEGRLAPQLVDDVRLLVTELVTNSVRHAGASVVGLDVRFSHDAVRIEVTNQGPSFSPRARQADQDERSGWGLYLVDRLADRWGVSSRAGRTSVWLELDQPRRA